MERSNFANILITTRLLPYFNSDNVLAMKSCIFGELGCANEREFLCKVLTMIYGSLSNKSTTTIKNKAVEIADLQAVALPVSSVNTKQAMATTVYKYIEDKYQDSLSNLNSDVIDHIGTFLTKQESISFGYLNKQLYIESQKLSYLVKRCKDSDSETPFGLDHRSVSRLLWSKSSAYSYNFPTHLSVSNFSTINSNIAYAWEKILTKDYFNNFFLRLNYLTCFQLEFVEHIPVSLLFNNKCNFYDSDESREYIEEFSISGQFKDDGDAKKVEAGFNNFCQKMEKYKQVNNGKNIRKIKCFRFNVEKASKNHFNWGRIGVDPADEKWIVPDSLKKLFLSCCELSDSIIIGCGIDRLGINSLAELQALFHPKLKHFGFEKGDFSGSNIVNISDEECKQLGAIGNLEEIEMYHGVMKSWRMDWAADNISLFNVLNFFDKLQMRRNIKRYIINWKAHHDSHERDELLTKLFFTDCEKYPLLKTVVFKITNHNSVASVLEYLVNHKKEIFVDKEIKFKLKYLEKIELEMDAKHRFLGGFGRIPPLLDGEDEDGDDFVANEQFVIEKRVITIYNAEECIQHIERNMSDWCDKIIAAKQTVSGRKVVLVL